MYDSLSLLPEVIHLAFSIHLFGELGTTGKRVPPSQREQSPYPPGRQWEDSGIHTPHG